MIKEKIEACFDALQELDLKPTPHNVSIMNGVFSVLREVYEEINKKEGADVGRTAVDTE